MFQKTDTVVFFASPAIERPEEGTKMISCEPRVLADAAEEMLRFLEI
jgi:hypothetical protein